MGPFPSSHCPSPARECHYSKTKLLNSCHYYKLGHSGHATCIMEVPMAPFGFCSYSGTYNYIILIISRDTVIYLKVWIFAWNFSLVVNFLLTKWKNKSASPQWHMPVLWAQNGHSQWRTQGGGLWGLEPPPPPFVNCYLLQWRNQRGCSQCHMPVLWAQNRHSSIFRWFEHANSLQLAGQQCEIHSITMWTVHNVCKFYSTLEFRFVISIFFITQNEWWL